MRIASLVGTLAVALTLISPTLGAGPVSEDPSPLIDASRFRPQIVFHDLSIVTDREFVTISGVVFSRSPIDRVHVGDRVARLRPAETADLVLIDEIPPGAGDAPYRVYFEVPDAKLQTLGANDLEIRAMSTNERLSDMHRLTIVRTAASGPADAS